MASDEQNTTSSPPDGSAPLSGSDCIPVQIQQQTDELPSTSPVELSQLSSQGPGQPANQTSSPPAPAEVSDITAQNERSTTTHGVPNAPQPPEQAHISHSRPTRPRQDSEAIGPSAEDSATASSYLQKSASLDIGPSVLVTLILLNGARHPYKIDQRYLRKRNVASEGQNIDPYAISVYTMKELIWRDWREEWDPRPTNPGAIRLIYFGKLLDDKQTLLDCRFRSNEPNAVHMTVRPQEFLDDEEHTKGGKLGASRLARNDDPEADTGCRCCVTM